MPIPTIDFSKVKQKSKHKDISDLQFKLNSIYQKILKADVRKKIVLERQFDADKKTMDTLLVDLFDLRELDQEVPTVEELYKYL